MQPRLKVIVRDPSAFGQIFKQNPQLGSFVCDLTLFPEHTSKIDSPSLGSGTPSQECSRSQNRIVRKLESRLEYHTSRKVMGDQSPLSINDTEYILLPLETIDLWIQTELSRSSKTYSIISQISTA